MWLRASPETIDARLAATDLASRPLLLGPDGHPMPAAERLARLRALRAAREPFYAQADVVVDANGAPEAVARETADALRAWRSL